MNLKSRASNINEILPQRSKRNQNQEAMKKEKTIEQIRKKILQAKKIKEDKPFGIDDKHVIEARTELEELQKEKLRQKGFGDNEIQEIIREEREIWIENTKLAKEKRENSIY